MKQKALSVALLALALPLSAQADQTTDRGTHSPRINERQENQQDRIKQGVASGELTKKEAHNLRDERRDIREKEQVYKSDGSLNKAERKDLRSDLRESSREIHDQKHDANKRP